MLLISDETKARLNPLMKSSKYSNEDFWQHEWTKHGSCMFSDAEEYFEKTLDLYDQFTPEKIFKRFGFYPDQAEHLHYNTLQSYFKRNVMPRCYHTSKDYFLTELAICFDEDFNQMDCPKKHVTMKDKQKCGDKFFMREKKRNSRTDL